MAPENSNAQSEPQPRKPDIFDDLKKLRKAVEPKVSFRPVNIEISVVRKTEAGQYFQSHPDPEVRIDAAILPDRASRDNYFVAENMLEHPKIKRLLRPVTIVPIFVWPGGLTKLWTVPILPIGRKAFHIHTSYRVAFEISAGLPTSIRREKNAKHEEIAPGETPPGPNWVTMVYNQDTGQVEFEEDEGISLLPEWPQMSLGEMLRLGFAGCIIDSDQHPYVKQLRGLSS
jgi:hypothetical protein